MPPGSAYMRWKNAARRRLRSHIRAAFGRRIPTVMVTGSVGKTTTIRMTARILEAAGHSVGMTTTDGITIAGRQISTEDSAGYQGARTVFRDPQITAAVLETARGGLIDRGLYVSRCDVAALLNVADVHIGMNGIDTIEAMGNLKRRVADAARDLVVLSADNAYCRKLSGRYPARRVCYFTLEPQNSFVSAHLARGGKALVVERRGGEEWIVWRDGSSVEDLLPSSDLPSTYGGIARHNIANAMAAAALVKGLGVDTSAIHSGLSGFGDSISDNPSRFNVFDGYPFRLIVDRARTFPAARALVEAQKKIVVPGKRICLLTAFGNRPDSHFWNFAAEVASAFDLYICYEDEAFRRGRAAGERNLRMTEGLLRAGATSRQILTAKDYEAAVRLIATKAEPGDLVLFLGADLPAVGPILSRILGESGMAQPGTLMPAPSLVPCDVSEAPPV